MKRALWLLILAAIAATDLTARSAFVAAQSESSKACLIPILRRGDGDASVEILSVPQGQFTVFKAPEVITFLLPPSPGRSGDFIPANKKSIFIAQCTPKELVLRIRQPEGSDPNVATERTLPPFKVEELEKYELRVNVIGKKVRKAFLIQLPSKVEVDEKGPVIDMFDGKYQVGEEDYVVTIEARERKSALVAKGSY